ncbi:MAG: hypothetical protein KC619_02500 [Myxococcales bacterium]|nr:hypothetical protein [Myxococcales bacterium]
MVSLLRPILAAVLLLAGCGAPAIVDASRGIAAARGCEPADLTLTEAPDGYATAGCGAAGFYVCSEGSCADAQGHADTSWVAEADRALAEIDDEVLACNDGQAFTLQLRFDRDGKPQGLASNPALGADQRVCVGRLVGDHVELDPFEGERLFAHRVGGAPQVAPPVAPPAEETPVEAEAPMEEDSPELEPAEAEDTSVPDDLVE